MNKGICFHFGYLYKSKEQQAEDIKAAGFNCVIHTADPKFNNENGNFNKSVKLIKRNNLTLSSLHARYEKKELPHFFMDDEIGERLEKDLIKDVKFAFKYGFNCVVVHLSGEANQIGFCRLRRVLDVCEKLNVSLALENLSNNANLLEQVFKNVKSDYLKFCWDVGHNHCFTPEIDFASIYKDKLVALHLHDNLGKDVPMVKYAEIEYDSINPDMHTLNKYGNIDWQMVAKKIADLNRPINLDYEVLMCYRKDETPKQVLEEVYEQACELELLIEKYKMRHKN